MPKQTKKAYDHRVVVPISWQEVASYAAHSMQCSQKLQSTVYINFKFECAVDVRYSPTMLCSEKAQKMSK